MAEDIQSARPSINRSRPGGRYGNPQMVPLLGIVKDNIDPTRAGRIFVYLANNSGLDPDSRDSWRPVKFLSPFYGMTRGDAAKDDYGNFKNNPSSYGMWAAPPDIGTTVLCLFVNGDLNYGFYIGCVPDPEAMQMIPAIGATDNVVTNKGEAESYGGALRLPVTNINNNNKSIADTPDYLTAAKPVHSYSSAIMFQQGILRDPIRGPISSSSQRETPSRVGWGVSTPGRPIYEGGFNDVNISENLDPTKDAQLRVVSRRGGHTIVMDDGDVIGRDNLIRIRTSLGHQILMSDDGQTLMILHSNGQSYIELGKEGTVDVYSTNSINLRTQGDLNFHADNNVNIHASKNLNIQAENIHINSEKEYKQRTGTNHAVSTGGKHTTKVSGSMSMESAGDISMASSAQAYVNGSKVLLNSGQTSTKPTEVPIIEKILHTDTLFEDKKGFLAAPAKLISITSRAPAHAPWANAGQGIDLKTNLNASSNLPQTPSPSVSATNTVAASAGISNPVASSTIASAPNTPAASSLLDQNTTRALAGQIASNAVTGPLSAAANQGTAIAQTAEGIVVGIGQFAQSPEQLELSGILKTGTAALVSSIAATTGNIQAAMPDSIFTGKPGAENLSTLINNLPAQAQSVATNLSKSQTSLQNAGVISGNESASQVAGLIMSASQNNLGDTIDAIKASSTTNSTNPFTNLGQDTADLLNDNFPDLLQGSVNGVMKNISAGNFAATLGQDAGGALGGLQTSIQSLVGSSSLDTVINQSAGVSAGAFSAIASSMKPLLPGVPQNLSAIAKEQSATIISVSLSGATNSLNQANTSLSLLAKNGLAGVKNNIGSELQGSAASAIGTPSSQTLLFSGQSLADSLIETSKIKAGEIMPGIVESSEKISSTPLLETTTQAFTNVKTLSRNPASSLDNLSTAAQTVSSGLSGSGAGALASGLASIPGGLSAASSITNLSKNKVPNLPGTENLKNSLEKQNTDLLNNIGSTLGSKEQDLLNTINNSSLGLSELIPKGIPSGVAAQLQGALGSVAAAGSGVKLPTVGLNTNNRTSITNAVTSQLEDPAIPVPNFGEVNEEAKSNIENIRENNTQKIVEYRKLGEEWLQTIKERDRALKTLDEARKRLPQGDPAIQEAQKAYNDAFYKSSIKLEEFKKFERKLDEQGINKGFTV